MCDIKSIVQLKMMAKALGWDSGDQNMVAEFKARLATAHTAPIIGDAANAGALMKTAVDSGAWQASAKTDPMAMMMMCSKSGSSKGCDMAMLSSLMGGGGGMDPMMMLAMCGKGC